MSVFFTSCDKSKIGPEQINNLKASADKGDAHAQKMLGDGYHKGIDRILPKDQSEALKWWHKAADQGNRGAMYSIGLSYGQGDGVPQDYAQAMNWWKKAATLNHAMAQHDIGVLYLNGNGVSKDVAEAARWVRKAAEQGEPEAKVSLGLLYGNLRQLLFGVELMVWV